MFLLPRHLDLLNQKLHKTSQVESDIYSSERHIGLNIYSQILYSKNKKGEAVAGKKITVGYAVALSSQSF